MIKYFEILQRNVKKQARESQKQEWSQKIEEKVPLEKTLKLKNI